MQHDSRNPPASAVGRFKIRLISKEEKCKGGFCGGYKKPKKGEHLDTQLFPECKGKPGDRDVVKKHERRKKNKKVQASNLSDLAPVEFTEFTMASLDGSMDQAFDDRGSGAYVNVQKDIEEDGSGTGETVYIPFAADGTELPYAWSIKGAEEAVNAYHGVESQEVNLNMMATPQESLNAHWNDAAKGMQQAWDAAGSTPKRKASTDLDDSLISDIDDYWKPIQSSFIDSVAYSPYAKVMEIKFKSGQKYTFWGISQEEYNCFMESPSKGAHFNELIRRNK